MQAAVIHLPFLQQPFSTVPLDAGDWLVCAAVGSSVLWLRELTKLAARLQEGPGGDTNRRNGDSRLD